MRLIERYSVFGPGYFLWEKYVTFRNAILFKANHEHGSRVVDLVAINCE
jgi:hypothetical protein